MPSKRKKTNSSNHSSLYSPVRSGIVLWLGILLCLIIVSAGFYGRYRQARLREQDLYAELVQIRELVTNRQVYRSVFYSRVKENFIQERSLLFTAQFHVSAGVDLSKGFSLNTSGRSASLILPPGGILSIDADDTSLKQVVIKERFSSVTTGDFLPLLTEEKVNIREQAVQKGLEHDAEARAKQIFYGMLRMAGYEKIHISFRREL